MLQAYVAGLLVVVFYAGNIITGKALAELPPVTIAFARLVIAFVVLLPIGWRSAWQARQAFIEHRVPLLVMALTGVAFFTTLIYGALQFTSATNVSVLEATIPVVTVAISAVVLGERLRALQWAGVAVSLFGAVYVVLDGNVLALDSIAWNVGDGIMVGAVLCWAVYSVAVRRHMGRFPAYGVLLVMTSVAVAVLFPFVLVEWAVTGGFPLGPGPHWWGLLYLGVFPSVVALALYNRVVATLGASRGASFLNLLPVATMLGAYLLLGEQISPAQVLGALLVMAGVFLTLRSGRWRPRGRGPAGHRTSAARTD